MKFIIKLKFVLLALLLLAIGCKDLDTVNINNPDRDAVLSNGTDLISVLAGGYISWWQAVHDDHPVIALSVTSDTYGLSLGNFGARRMGEEPRASYNNRSSETEDYKKVVEAPWFACLSAVSSANDVINALDGGVTIDKGGPQDQLIRAGAHFLRAVSWGYLGLIFDQALLVDENTDLQENIPFTAYGDMIAPAVQELEQAIGIAKSVGGDFSHSFFNGVALNADQFVKLCHSYAARFLTQWPRTEDEAGQIDWQSVLDHTEQGLDFDFAPLADGTSWLSYQKYAFAQTGQGPFWVRVDQRLIAALDPSQPTRYPQVVAGAEAPLTDSVASSDDARLESDFIFVPANNFPVDRGEWHFSHYKHNRNITDPTFAGDGSSAGPMPAFIAADNDLLKEEALLKTGRTGEAIALINIGTRVTRGQLPPLDVGASFEAVERAIMYERAIELLSTAPMGLWFDRRRIGPRMPFDQVDDLGGLQIGTPAHLPVPAAELNVHGLPPYNFGGPEDPEGVKRIF